MAEKDRASCIIIDEAARELGTTVLAVLMHVKQKRLAGKEIDGAWYITRESLSQLDSGERSPKVFHCKGHCGDGSGCRSGE